jgi:predicted GIY-YIG superfamily endonuclease
MTEQTSKDFYVYTLHFSEFVGHALHYTGITTKQGLRARMLRHARGYGANLTARAVKQGAKLSLVSLIDAEGYGDEQRIKRASHARARCSICVPDTPFRKFAPKEVDPALEPVAPFAPLTNWQVRRFRKTF